jgi:hypothetical protein
MVLSLVGFLTLSLIRGQERTTVPATAPATTPPPAPRLVPPPAADARPLAIDPAKLDGAPRQFFLGAKRGAEWLTRMNGANGRFLNGWVPSLNAPLDGDNFQRQAGAAFALARAARLTGEDRYTACAARAILSLLDETVLDADSQVRHVPLVLNRLGSAALLVLAINELPAPPADLLDKSEQLCNYIHSQARPNGLLDCGTASGNPDEPDALNQYPGQALYAVARSAKLRPADWKTALLRNAVAVYLPSWRANKNVACVPWQTAAFAEAYLLTRDRALADAVFEMNDWLVTLQYDLANNNQHPEWVGGFRGWSEGHATDTAPTAQAGQFGESLALACRTARQAGDDKRLASYNESLLGCLQFVATLQYTDANTTHFVPLYRDRLTGAVHASTQDGTLRLDYTQHAVSAMALFVELAVAR